MLKYLTINTDAEIICLIIALICVRNDKSIAWRSMTLFMFITCVAELLGVYFRSLYLKDMAHAHPNGWVYNILIIFQAMYINLMFCHILNSYTNSKPLIICGVALLFVLYTYDLINHYSSEYRGHSDYGIYKYNNLTNTVMSVLFVIYSFYYYYYLIKDKFYENLQTSASFWWVTGILFFYFGSTACNLFYNKLHGIVISPKHYLTYYIYNALNVILYGCWSYSLICRKWISTISKV